MIDILATRHYSQRLPRRFDIFRAGRHRRGFTISIAAWNRDWLGRGSGPELAVYAVEPLRVGQPVRAELLDPVLFLAEEEGPIGTELAGGRRIDQRAAVVGAHLEEDADLELLQALAVEGPVQVIHAVAPDQGMHGHRGALLEDRRERLRGRGRLVCAEAGGEAEVVVALTDVAEPLDVVDQQVDRRQRIGIL